MMVTHQQQTHLRWFLIIVVVQQPWTGWIFYKPYSNWCKRKIVVLYYSSGMLNAMMFVEIHREMLKKLDRELLVRLHPQLVEEQDCFILMVNYHLQGADTIVRMLDYHSIRITSGTDSLNLDFDQTIIGDRITDFGNISTFQESQLSSICWC